MAEVALATVAAAAAFAPGTGASAPASTALAPPFAYLLTALAEPAGAAATSPTSAKAIAPPIALPGVPALPDTADAGAAPTGADSDGNRATDGPADAALASATPTPDLSAFLALIAAPAQTIGTSLRPPVASDVRIAMGVTRSTLPNPSAPARGPAAAALTPVAPGMTAVAGTTSGTDKVSAPVEQIPAGAAPVRGDAVGATSPDLSMTVDALARMRLPQDATVEPAAPRQEAAGLAAPTSPPDAAAPAMPASPVGATVVLASEPPRAATPRLDASPVQGPAIVLDAPPQERTVTAAAATPLPDAAPRTGASPGSPLAVEQTSAAPAISPAAGPLAPNPIDDAIVPTRAAPANRAEPMVATAGGTEPRRPATSPARRIPEHLRVADVRIAPAAPGAALAAAATAAPTPAADDPVARQLSIAQDGQWLDALTRDIASAGNVDGQLRFRLDPDHLGSLTVQIAQGSDGASIRLTASTEAARTILADAQPRLVAEARAQGLTLRDATVETRSAAPAAAASPTSTGAGFTGGGAGGGRGDQGGVAAQLQQQSQQQQSGGRPRAPEAARQANPAPRTPTSTRSGADLYA